MKALVAILLCVSVGGAAASQQPPKEQKKMSKEDIELEGFVLWIRCHNILHPLTKFTEWGIGRKFDEELPAAYRVFLLEEEFATLKRQPPKKDLCDAIEPVEKKWSKQMLELDKAFQRLEAHLNGYAAIKLPETKGKSLGERMVAFRAVMDLEAGKALPNELPTEFRAWVEQIQFECKIAHARKNQKPADIDRLEKQCKQRRKTFEDAFKSMREDEKLGLPFEPSGSLGKDMCRFRALIELQTGLPRLEERLKMKK